MRPLFLLLLLLAIPGAPRAEALAPPGNGSCVAASVEARPLSPGTATLYRIVFINRCEQPRSFFWCAENPASPPPGEIACPRAAGERGFTVELRHTIQRRREFQWFLPAGTRIRFHDCPGQELPTSDFGCAPAASAAPRR